MDLEVIQTTGLPEAKRFCTEEKVKSMSLIENSITTEEQEIKTKRKEYKKLCNSMPKIRLREHGEIACLTVDSNARIPIFLMDIQHLIMYSQMGPAAPYNPLRWCQLERVSKIETTSILLVENMTLFDYTLNESKFPYLSNNFKQKLEMISSNLNGYDFIQEFLFVPLTSSEINKYNANYGDLETAATKDQEVFSSLNTMFPMKATKNKIDKMEPSADEAFPRTSLLLSGWQMIEENFPLPIKGIWRRKYKGYVLTKEKYEEVTPQSPMFAIDCEMCRTTSGDLELTRITIVNENLKSIYEELVKPNNKIVDYLTQYSGITEKLMKKATKNLKEVQEDVKKLLPPDAIIVGQSLSSDFHALKIMHPYVIDTSIIFNLTGHRAKKSKLKDLARVFLNEKIQQSKRGHCSKEDSSASLKLVKLKLSKSLYFGDAVMSSTKMNVHPELGHSHFGKSMLRHLAKEKKSLMVVGLEDCAQKYSFYTFKTNEIKRNKSIVIKSEKTNEDVVHNLKSSARTQNVRIAHCKYSREEITANAGELCEKVDNWVREIDEKSAFPSFTVVVFTGDVDGSSGCCFISLKNF